jgi:hypothetical protein
MGRSKEVAKQVLDALRKSPQTEKELRKHILSDDTEVTKKHVKKALQKLVEKAEIVEDGKIYKIASSESSSSSSDSESAPLLTAAEILRQKTAQNTKKSVKFSEPEVDYDEEIRRLEQELEGGSESSSGEEDSDEEDSKDPTVLSLSTLADDRIEALPANYLPVPLGKKRLLKGIDQDYKQDEERSRKRAKHEPSAGLRAAVKEVLDGYKPRSAERLPFYCRVCSKQYNDEDEFLEHKTTEFHVTAEAMEKKATFCKLCRKQLTSPAQMKEHLMSRPHKERLQKVRDRQPNREQRQPGGQRNSSRQWT